MTFRRISNYLTISMCLKHLDSQAVSNPNSNQVSVCHWNLWKYVMSLTYTIWITCVYSPAVRQYKKVEKWLSCYEELCEGFCKQLCEEVCEELCKELGEKFWGIVRNCKELFEKFWRIVRNCKELCEKMWGIVWEIVRNCVCEGLWEELCEELWGLLRKCASHFLHVKVWCCFCEIRPGQLAVARKWQWPGQYRSTTWFTLWNALTNWFYAAPHFLTSSGGTKP